MQRSDGTAKKIIAHRDVEIIQKDAEILRKDKHIECLLNQLTEQTERMNVVQQQVDLLDFD